jgi:hypothetical protein
MVRAAPRFAVFEAWDSLTVQFQIGTLLRNLWRASQNSATNAHTIRFVTGVASEDTLSVGTERACQALDGCLQPEEFDSPVLRTAVQPNWEFGDL